MADLEDRLSAAGEQWRSAHNHVAEPDFAAVTAVSAVGSPESVPEPVTGDRSGATRRRWRWIGPVLAAAVVAGVVVTAVSLRGRPTAGPSTAPVTATAPSSPGGVSVTDPAALVGTTWQLIAATFDGTGLAQRWVNGVTIEFTSRGSLIANACNTYTATVKVNRGTLEFPSRSITATTSSCTNPVIDPLFTATDWEIVAGELHISSSSADLTFRPASESTTAPTKATTSPSAAPITDPAQLYGKEWQLIESTYGSKHLTGPEAEAATIRFDGKGGMTGHACNYLGGTAKISEGTMTISPGMTTDMLCSSETEPAIQPLFSPATWKIVDGELHIRSAAGELTFRVRPSIYPSDPLPAGSHVLDEGARHRRLPVDLPRRQQEQRCRRTRGGVPRRSGQVLGLRGHDAG